MLRFLLTWTGAGTPKVSNKVPVMLNVFGSSCTSRVCYNQGTFRSLKTSSFHIRPQQIATTSHSSFFEPFFSNFKRLLGYSSTMGYFVIGVSGVTCGGKTSLTKLLQRTFPCTRVIHQDHYFYDDDWPNHVRTPEAENHVNYEILQSLNMTKMYEDVQKILEEGPGEYTPPLKTSSNSILVGDKAETPNFDDTFLKQIKEIDVDVSKHDRVPILIIEGFTIFASQFLFDKCHARFFCTLDKETCKARRLLRTYVPPDSPSYFDKVIWPEYEKHVNEYVHNRSGITVFDGKTPMEKIWKDSVQIAACRIEENFGDEKFKTTREGLIV